MSGRRSLRDVLLHRVLIRRAVTIPFAGLLFLVVVAALPVVVIADGIGALFLTALRGTPRHRPGRVALFAAVYLTAEIVGLGWAAVLWIRHRLARVAVSPRRPATSESPAADAWVDANIRILRTLLAWLYRVAVRAFGLRLDIGPADRRTAGGACAPDAPAAGTRPQSSAHPFPAVPAGDRPLLVFSRHAGPGDSFLLVYALLEAALRPLVVLKDVLVLDPLVDVLIGRLGHRFVDPHAVDGASAVAGIGALAAAAGPRDALVLFPEGGNFTAARREHVIRRLRRTRRLRAALRAQQLTYVLPPRPGGMFAALDAAPDATVVFVAHTGLDHLESAGQVWDALPLSGALKATWWTVDRAGIPDGEDEREQWLQQTWLDVDAWIGRHRTESAEPVTSAEPAADEQPPAVIATPAADQGTATAPERDTR